MRNIAMLAGILGLMLGVSFPDAKSPEEFLGSGPTVTPKTTPVPPKPTGTKKPPVQKPKAATFAVGLDTAKVHAVYMEGDFDQATKVLEGYLNSGQVMSHSDSVFTFKHLGVMYAASANSREKGRYFMYHLINIEPTAKILDMYASDMIYLIFRNVQEDFELKHSQAKKDTVDSNRTPIQSQSMATTSAPSPVQGAPTAALQAKRKYWITGGVVVAAGAAGLLYILLDSPKSKTHTIVVSE